MNLRRHTTAWILCTAIFALVNCQICVGATVPTLTPTEMRQDLLYLRDVWAPKNRSFNAAELRQFKSVVANDLRNKSAMSVANFAFEVARAVATAHNGHTWAAVAKHWRHLPIRMYMFSDGLYIVRAEPKFADLLGAKVERFGPLTTDQAVARVSPYISGVPWYVRQVSSRYLRFIEVLHHIGASPSDFYAPLTLRLPNGSTRTVTLRPEDVAEPGVPYAPSNNWSALYPAPKHISGRWPDVLDRLHSVPLAFRPPNDLTWTWIGPDRKALYIRSNWILGDDPHSLGLFGELYGLLQTQVAPRRPSRVIVDLRFNGGGDYANTILFAQALPKLIAPGGKIFVLVGHQTFSAAIVTAALLRQYGGRKVVLVGERMGDTNPFWAEGGPMTLPNSKFRVYYASREENWKDGCNNRALCYWANTVFGDTPTSLQPEIRVPFNFADYAAGHDRALEAVLAARD